MTIQKRTLVDYLTLTITMVTEVQVTTAEGTMVKQKKDLKTMFLQARAIVGIIDVEDISEHGAKSQIIVNDGTDYFVMESIDEIADRLCEINMGL